MSTRGIISFTLVVSLISAFGCPQTPPRVLPPSINASAAGSKAIELYDTDKDGKISGAELDKCAALKSAMGRIDKTNSGAITADQITVRIKEWQASKLGRTSATCTVTKNGRPLSGATVKFVPEKFLGENMIPAEGKTDANGTAMISVPTKDRKDPPGVPPGLYRVEVAKEGENVPAKYNAETTLGLEIANDANNQEGVRFDLKY